jgi:hypothetical protein
MEEVKKITEQELEVLTALKQEAISVASALGELNYQKMLMELQLEEFKAKIKELKVREIDFFKNLKEIYGTVSININTGEFQ